MSSADRLATMVERIEALSRRMENHMRDPLLALETRTRIAYLHAQWRDLLLANMAAMEELATLLPDCRERLAENIVFMERVTALLREIDISGAPPDDAAPPDGEKP